MKTLAGTPFQIILESLHWIKNDGMDDPDDLCLHGHIFVVIGEDAIECDATISAAGLYLLRTLTENHIIHDGEAMLPHCGNSMIANDDLSAVDIFGCPNGIDWSVIHEADKIRLITEMGKETLIGFKEYSEEVFAFADKIKSYYDKCQPKNIPSMETERDGYVAFWNEWNRREKQKFV